MIKINLKRKEDQIKEDFKFGGYSETDTEVLANLIALNLKKGPAPIDAIALISRSRTSGASTLDLFTVVSTFMRDV